MAAELLPERYQPPKRRFSWLGDPAEKFRGAGKANITGADAAAMLAYNQSLYEPMDRGGGQAIRINDAPVTFSGTPPPAPPGWQIPVAGTAANIERQYGGGRPGIVSLRTPVSVATGGGSPQLGTPSPVSTPTPPTLNPVTAVDPPLGQSVSGPAFDPQGNPFPPSGSEKPPVTTLHGTDPSVGAALTGEESARAAIMGQKPSSTQDEADRKAEWTARGGSDATYHRKQVEEGRRAPIDARATVSPLNSTASQDIQKKWGWGGQRGLPY